MIHLFGTNSVFIDNLTGKICRRHSCHNSSTSFDKVLDMAGGRWLWGGASKAGTAVYIRLTEKCMDDRDIDNSEATNC